MSPREIRGGLSIVRYRIGRTLRQRLGGYIALVVLIGLIGGLSLASIAGARRTQSSYPIFLAATNPSDLSLGTGLLNPSLGYASGYDRQLIKRISSQPGVERARSFAELALEPLGNNGQPIPAVTNPNVTYNVFGSVDGEYFTQDRVTVVEGRMANPSRPDQIVATSGAAEELGLHLGKASPWGIYSDAEAASLSSGGPVTPLKRVDLTLVGVVIFNNGVVEDDTDAANNQAVILTPALSRPLTSCCSYFTFTNLQLQHHEASVGPIESEIVRVMPAGLPHDFFDPTVLVGKVEHAIKPEAVALGVFGAIAALAALMIAAQLMARQLRSWRDEADVLRALGAPPATTLADGVAGIAASVLLGALLACLVSVAFSPLFPLGPVRAVYPDAGFSVDWTVLGLGILVIVGVLWCIALLLAHRLIQPGTGHGATRRDTMDRTSKLATAAAKWGAPAPAVTGIRFAFGGGADTVGVRSATLGAVLALVVMVATVVFGASLDSLVSRPALYGWNWAYELSGGGGVGDIPRSRAQTLLARDHEAAAWSPYYFANMQIDGRTVPALGGNPGATVNPPVLNGHGLEHPGQVVFGVQTLQLLHKTIGDTVVASYGATNAHLLRIVGTATMPAIGSGVTGHLTMGTGAWIDYHLIPASVRNSFHNSPAGPNALFVQLRPGVGASEARKGLAAIAEHLSLPTNYGVTLVGVERPAEIVNYRTMGSTPAILGVALGASAVAALALSLVASVRRRRREMAVLKTMGFTSGQFSSKCGLAGERRCVGRRHCRGAAGHRRRPLALDPLRRSDLCRSRPNAPSSANHLGVLRRARTGHRGLSHS